MPTTSSPHNPQTIGLMLPQGTTPELMAAIGDAALRAFHEHGAVAFAAPRQATAVHEAGHAIVGTAEGFRIRSLMIFPQSAPGLGEIWAGRCMEAGGKWTTGPDSSADDDLRRARFCIAGLAAEAVTGLDKPGSSLDELALSQLLGVNAGVKLGDPMLSDAEHSAYVQQLWHQQVWEVAISILRANRTPFVQLANYLNQHERIDGKQLHKMLAEVVRRITS
jgi:hypothetical protein